MYEDDRDALAAEYVLGTLSVDERDHAEALLAIDQGFAEIVRVWERRLGELNVMVEAVEPPPDVWDRIRGEIGTVPQSSAGATRMPTFAATAPQTAPEAIPEMAAETVPSPDFDLSLKSVPDLLSDTTSGLDLGQPVDLDAQHQSIQDLNTQDLNDQDAHLQGAVDETAPLQDLSAPVAQDFDEAAAVAALASSLLPPEPHAEMAAPPEQSAPLTPAVGRDADVIELQRGVRRWRGMTVAIGAIAAVLAIYVAVVQFAPGLIPNRRQPTAVATQTSPAGARLVAVLQQEPTAPAFLLTLDPQTRTYTVRTVTAMPEAGRSYELWLISGKYPSPRSLGLVGGEEFTSRPLPTGLDVDAMRGASYAVSLEPAGGSPKGVPTGPILFTGKMVEAIPGASPS